ncbi:hypothetical protein ASA_P5G112 (plasmid) [Aeromonas salmonicida subsp. salmonicida A449]|uniref:Uncharacterized protein n=1 Tax=Aeromonas salmonicida (strain A449) TaxID=382245 RepID=A4SUL0_AERS4|nr:hypothetical protein ASA_P5G112 [Aeromonas salmonicida subsp. salmonicida A449]
MTTVEAGATKNPAMQDFCFLKAKVKRTLPHKACLLAGTRWRTDAIAYRPAPQI